MKKKESLEEKKQKILNCAIELFAENGNFTIRELSKKSGINVASITYYFDGKENLMFEIEKIMVSKMHSIGYFLEGIEEKNVIETLANEMYDFIKIYPGFFMFLIGMNINQNLPYIPRYLQEEITKGPLKEFIYNFIEKESGIKDSKELENRCVFFYSCIAFVVMYGSQKFSDIIIPFEVDYLSSKESFIAYIKSLFALLVSKENI